MKLIEVLLGFSLTVFSFFITDTILDYIYPRRKSPSSCINTNPHIHIKHLTELLFRLNHTHTVRIVYIDNITSSTHSVILFNKNKQRIYEFIDTNTKPYFLDIISSVKKVSFISKEEKSNTIIMDIEILH
jgi:hypothetical protein